MSGTFQQQDDFVPWKRTLAVLLAVIVFGIALCVWAYGTLVHRENQLRPGRRFPEARLNPPHTVQKVLEAYFPSSIGARELNDEKRKQLGEWRWIDRDQRVVGVPIDRAIDQVVERAGEERR